jgi:Fic family protein
MPAKGCCRAERLLVIRTAEHPISSRMSLTSWLICGSKDLGPVTSHQKGSLDITTWMRWFLGCLDRAFDGAEATLAVVLRKARFWESHAGESLNERQQKIVNRLLDGFEGKLTSSKWAKIAKCSQDTASRDIADLVKRGVLAKDAAGGRSTSYSHIERAEKTGPD